MLRDSMPVWLRLPLEMMISVSAGIFVALITGKTWIGILAAALFMGFDLWFTFDRRRSDALPDDEAESR